MSDWRIKSISMAAAAAMTLTLLGGGMTALAEQPAAEQPATAEEKPEYRYEYRYWDLLDAYSKAGRTDYTGAAVELSLEPAMTAGGADHSTVCEGRRALAWTAETEELSLSVTVPEDALYTVTVDYYALNDKSTDIQRALLVDGDLPCAEWNDLRLSRLFVDDGDIREDINGDQSAPRMKQVYAWQTAVLSDSSGYYSDPMKLYLTAGEHTLTFRMRGNQPVALGSVRLTAPPATPDYAAVSAQYEANGYAPATQPLILEAEDTAYRSAASLRLDSAADLSCQPADMTNTVVNIAGGSAWKSGRQTLTWRLDVPESGLYQLAFHAYSYYNYGTPAYRRVCIDGELPFAEMAAYCFRPSTRWRAEVLSDEDGTPYLFYLTAGEHKLSLSTVSGAMLPIIRQLDEDMDVLSDLYLDITLITTSDPDVNYDYRLDERVPGLMGTLRGLQERLSDSAELLRTACGNNKAINYNEMRNTIEDLQIMMDDVFEIPANLDQFTTILTQYGNWISALTAGTVSLDTVQLLPPDMEPQVKRVSWWQRLCSGVLSFIATFSKDYSSVIGSGEYDADMPIIDVWYGGTQIWAAEIQDLIDTSFAPQHQMQVRFKLTPAAQMSTGINAMLLALISGNAPDAVLSAASISDYAIRNQLYDMTQFPDFDEVAARFPEVCFKPLTYRGAVYGMPQTLELNFMFYRTDVFRKLGLSVPQTWEEMISDVIPKLAENSMTLAASPGYNTLLFQLGGELYNEDMTESRVADSISWNAFKQHCDFYTMYGVPKSANFFNRFRTGETPVGFGGIAQYIQFVYAAPELAGRWSVAVMPGVRQADGTINHTIGSLLSGAAMILADAKHKPEAWTFLKWYMETDTQIELSEQLEAKLDMSARLLSANVEAFSGLDWDRGDLQVFLEAMKQAKAYNPVLGDYYTDRYVNYAFNYVVISKSMTEREALEYAEKNINNELERRRNGLT